MNPLYPQPKSVEAAERGGETELRFFEAMQCPFWKKPFWLLSVRHATRAEDNLGVDAIVLTDVGVIEVQIKTSHAGRLAHIARYGREHVITVISPFMSARRIRHTVTDILYQRRGRLYSQLKRATSQK